MLLLLKFEAFAFFTHFILWEFGIWTKILNFFFLSLSNKDIILHFQKKKSREKRTNKIFAGRLRYLTDFFFLYLFLEFLSFVYNNNKLNSFLNWDCLVGNKIEFCFFFVLVLHSRFCCSFLFLCVFKWIWIVSLFLWSRNNWFETPKCFKSVEFVLVFYFACFVFNFFLIST